jgi:hypothetical protein
MLFKNRRPHTFQFSVIFVDQIWAKLITLAEFQTEVWLQREASINSGNLIYVSICYTTTD